MALKNLDFIFDENIPIGLLKVFKIYDFNCTTVQKLGWNGDQDKEIAQKMRNTKIILLNRDKDFHFLWEKYDLLVIHLMIEPATLKHIYPVVEKFLAQWKFDNSSPFLLILQKENIRYWKKT